MLVWWYLYVLAQIPFHASEYLVYASVSSVCVIGVGLGTVNGVLALGLAAVSFTYGLADGAGRSRPPGFRPKATFTGVASLSLLSLIHI